MKRWLSRTQLRQRPRLAVYAGLLVIVVVGTVIFALPWLSSPSQDRLAVIANFLSLGTLLLALIAGIVALAAYSAATGLPNLRLKVNDLDTYSGDIFLVCENMDNQIAATGENNIARLIVENTTSYAARTPAVIIEFRNCAIRRDMYAATNDWTPTEREEQKGDVQAIQWDGGPNYAIHGNSTRHLPEINLQGLYAIPPAHPVPRRGRPPISPAASKPRVIVKLLADGYSRPDITLGIGFVAQRSGPWLGAPEWL
jgi:hypothetical protein